jgi:hypothetical protein
MQHDIIGSDFRGKQEIGNAAAERYQQAVDLWFPIEKQKRTIGGELIEFKILNFIFGDEIDTDHNLHIIPSYDYATDFRRSIDVAIKRMNGEDCYVDSDVDWGIGCKSDDFKNYRVKEMEFEIDLHKSTAKNYFAPGKVDAPVTRSGSRAGDMVFAYGPWVSDALHCYKPEIHPAEQIWWRKKLNEQQKTYHLLLTCDQSDRFDDEDDFDENEIFGCDRELKKVWAPRPLEGTFAILFAVDPAKEMVTVNLNRIGGQTVTSLYNDGKINYLVYKGDTVAIVKEPSGSDVLKIDFENLHWGIDKKTMYGYITIQARVGQAKQGTFDNSDGGYLFLSAKETIVPVKRKPRIKDNSIQSN